tara:strand:- start:14398 stop:15249 length:852 start_codon:yes stop_codon:yes gene_type:complete
MSSDQGIQSEIDKRTSSESFLGSSLISTMHTRLSRQFLLTGFAGLMSFGAMAQEPAEAQPKDTLNTQTPTEISILNRPTMVDDVQNAPISWGDIVKPQAQTHAQDDDKLEGWERWNVVLTSGSRHIGAHTYAVESIETIDLGDLFGDLSAQFPQLNDMEVNIKTVTQEPYNEFNPGVGAEYRLNNNFHAAAGIYKNSISGISVYLGAGAETNRDKFLGAGIDVGAVTGYMKDVVPSAFPYMRLGREDQVINAQVGGIPAIENITPAVVALRLRVNLDPVFDPE